MTKKVAKVKKVCIVGCGHISSKHAEAIVSLRDIKLCAASDISKDKVISFSDKYNCKPYLNYNDMFEVEKPDAVHICVPHYLHAEIALTALNYGINIILEKPGALSVSDFDQMIDLQKRTGGFCTVMFQNRLNKSVIRAQEIVESEKYGKILGCSAMLLWNRNTEYYLSSKWRSKQIQAGGGVLITQAIHTIDLLRYIMGDIDSVKTMKGNIKHINLEVEDSFCAAIKFKNNIEGVIFTTVASPCNMPAEINIYFERACLTISGVDLLLKYRENNAVIIKHVISGENADICYGNGHHKFIEKFYRDINCDKMELPTIEDAKKTFLVLEKLYGYCAQK